MRVAVLAGGRSSEHEVSLRSAASVARGLQEAGHEVVTVTIGRSGEWRAGEEPVTLEAGAGLLGADAVFPALHGPFGEDGSVQGLLENLDVPYVGSDVLASATCMDKLTLKRLCAQGGVPQVEFVAVDPDRPWRDECAQLGLPLWVKPSRLGSSVGISRVVRLEELDAAAELALRHDPRVIVEAAAPAAALEVECSVLGNEPGALETSPPGQLAVNADWYDYEAKYQAGGMDLIIPAPLPDDQLAHIRTLAAEIFTLAGCSGLARCDFFAEPGGQVLVNEVNTMPGFTETSVYAKLFEAGGLAYPDLCDRLVRLGIERHQKARSYEF